MRTQKNIDFESGLGYEYKITYKMSFKLVYGLSFEIKPKSKISFFFQN